MDLDSVLNLFEQAFTSNMGQVMGYLRPTMYMLLTIDFVLAVLNALIANGNMLQLLIEKILKYGFWVWVFNNGLQLVNQIADTMAIIGAAIGGDASIIRSPGAILQHGVSIIQPIWKYASENAVSLLDLNVGQFITLGFVCIFIFVCFLIITIQAAVTYIEFYAASVFAIVLIPFGVNRYTSFLSEKALGAIPASGIKIAALQAVLGVTAQVLNKIAIQVETSDLYSLGDVVGTCSICALICWQVPAIVSGLLAGSPSLTAGTAAGNAAAFTSGAMAGARIAANTPVKAAKGGIAAVRAASMLTGKIIDKMR